MAIARRTVLRGAGAALALPATAWAQSEEDKQLYDAAKKEGQLTWYSGILNQPICERSGRPSARNIRA